MRAMATGGEPSAPAALPRRVRAPPPGAAPAAPNWGRLWRRALAGLARPRALLGLGAGLSLLLALGSLADWRQVGALASRLTPAVLVLLAAGPAAGAYCRAARWLIMLRASGVAVCWRRALAAWFGAELLGPLPASPFVACYLLRWGGAASIWATAPVVLAGLWVDVLVVVGGAVLVPDGLPPAIRLAGALLCGGGLLALPAIHWPPVRRAAAAAAGALATAGRRRWPRRERWWALLDALPSWWARPVAAAFAARSLLPAAALTAVPVALGAALTSLVAATLGFPQLTPARVWAAAGLTLIVALASPLPFDLGVTEGASVVAYGWAAVPPPAALAISLLGRISYTTISLLLAAAAVWLLRDELA